MMKKTKIITTKGHLNEIRNRTIMHWLNEGLNLSNLSIRIGSYTRVVENQIGMLQLLWYCITFITLRYML